MKTILAAALVTLAFLTPAHADDDHAAYCAALGELAHDIMRHRQNGLAMSAQISAAQAVSAPPVIREMATAMIFDAYDEPRWNSDLTRRLAADDFRNSIEAACFRVAR